jgi:hypothetical protein
MASSLKGFIESGVTSSSSINMWWAGGESYRKRWLSAQPISPGLILGEISVTPRLFMADLLDVLSMARNISYL